MLADNRVRGRVTLRDLVVRGDGAAPATFEAVIEIEGGDTPALVANYEVPKEIVVLDELPMLPIGKVDKVALTRASGRDPAD